MTTSDGSSRHQLAAEVRALCARHGLSQTDLASLLGLTQPPTSRRLSGASPFTFDEVVTIAKHFELTLDDLYEGRHR